LPFRQIAVVKWCTADGRRQREHEGEPDCRVGGVELPSGEPYQLPSVCQECEGVGVGDPHENDLAREIYAMLLIETALEWLTPTSGPKLHLLL
jgi:hypothetical protein